MSKVGINHLDFIHRYGSVEIHFLIYEINILRPVPIRTDRYAGQGVFGRCN